MTKKNTGFVRKHFFIDRNFQGRYMLTFLIPMIIMMVFMLGTLYFVSQTIMQVTVRTIKQNIESKVASGLQDSRSPTPQEYRAVLEHISEYVRTFSSSRDYRNSVLSSLLWVVGTGLILVIFQIVLLTVFFSHKVAGPVYRFEKVCNNMIEGNYTDEIKLRKGDEMQNLASLLNDVIRTSRERIDSLGKTIDEEERRKILSSIQI